MANTRELRRRIRSVKNTAQITKAMQMVSATKMRRAQNQAVNGRPYSFNLNLALKRLLPLVDTQSHPLLIGHDSKTQGIILLSTDKSLCGALNTNLFRLILMDSRLRGNDKEKGGNDNVVFYTVGRKGREFVVRTGNKLLADFENSDAVVFRQAAQLSKLVTEAFLNGEIGEAYITFPRFISTLRQEAAKVKLLPIEYSELESVILGSTSTTLSATPESKKDNGKEFLFEPDPKKLLDFILNHYIEIKIYQSMMETKASEHSARMMAMQNATDNALELVDDLNLAYNKTRQDSITKELLEITTASLAMQ